MNVLFVGVCGLGMAFFGVFLEACHQDTLRTRSHRSSVIKVFPETRVIDSPAGRHFLFHLEKQMADFITHHTSADDASSPGDREGNSVARR